MEAAEAVDRLGVFEAFAKAIVSGGGGFHTSQLPGTTRNLATHGVTTVL